MQKGKWGKGMLWYVIGLPMVEDSVYPQEGPLTCPVNPGIQLWKETAELFKLRLVDE